MYADLVRELLDIRSQMEPLEARAKDIEKTLRGAPKGTHYLGGGVVTVSTNARLDTKALAAQYPPDQYPQLYTQTLDTDAVKKAFAPNVLESFKVEGDPRLTVKRA